MINSLSVGQVVQYSDLSPWEDCEILEIHKEDDEVTVRFIEDTDDSTLRVWVGGIRLHPAKVS